MRYKVKKLFNGFASIRDHIINKCLDLECDLIIEFEDKEMTVPLSDLDSPFQLHEREFISKYNGTKYKLYDFKFVPSDDNQEELELSWVNQ